MNEDAQPVQRDQSNVSYEIIVNDQVAFTAQVPVPAQNLNDKILSSASDSMI